MRPAAWVGCAIEAAQNRTRLLRRVLSRVCQNRRHEQWPDDV